MLRPIDGFHQDEHGDWVAELRCGHGQHVRHQPPFQLRPWVVTEEGRTAKLGTELACAPCERFEMPKDYVPYKRTAEFTTHTVPAALKHQHSTKAGVWGVINVLDGHLRYIVEPPLVHEKLLQAGSRAVIVPEVLHRVVPEGEVRFFVELYRRPT